MHDGCPQNVFFYACYRRGLTGTDSFVITSIEKVGLFSQCVLPNV